MSDMAKLRVSSFIYYFLTTLFILDIQHLTIIEVFRFDCSDKLIL